MKKVKQIHKPGPKLTAEEIVGFLDDYTNLVANVDQKTKLISLRVPANVLHAFKSKAVLEGHKYQSVIVRLMREWVKK